MHLSADQWTRLFQESPVPLAFVLPDHKFAQCNTAFCELVGYPEGELLGRTWQSITHFDDVASDLAGATQIASNEGRDTYVIDKRYVSRRGYTIPVRLAVTAIRDSEGRFTGYFCCAFAEFDPSRGGEVTVRPPPGIKEWIRNNPKDAIIVALGGILLFGRETVIELIKLYLK